MFEVTEILYKANKEMFIVFIIHTVFYVSECHKELYNQARDHRIWIVGQDGLSEWLFSPSDFDVCRG